MQIINLCPDNLEAIQQAATLLVESFKEHWSTAWPDLASGLAEVKESLNTDRISRIAVDEAGVVLGWIGGIQQ